MQAFDTEQTVKSWLQLLPNHRFGNILLYSVGGELVYFILVYTTEGVIAKMLFIGPWMRRPAGTSGSGMIPTKPSTP